MENPSSQRTVAGALEENILAILDSTEADDTQYANDDRKSYFVFRFRGLVSGFGCRETKLKGRFKR
jgi:hypothetical protein